MLACDHDLCLNCAAMIFVAEDTTQDTRKVRLHKGERGI